MFISGYYAIAPKSNLKEKLKTLKLDSSLADIIGETVFWEHQRVSDFKKNSGDDMAEVKLLFLANLMSEYLSEEIYEQVLGDSDISLEVFDKWWKIEKYLIDENFADVEKRIAPSVAKKFVKTGKEGVDLWIQQLLKSI